MNENRKPDAVGQEFTVVLTVLTGILMVMAVFFVTLFMQVPWTILPTSIKSLLIADQIVTVLLGLGLVVQALFWMMGSVGAAPVVRVLLTVSVVAQAFTFALDLLASRADVAGFMVLAWFVLLRQLVARWVHEYELATALITGALPAFTEPQSPTPYE